MSVSDEELSRYADEGTIVGGPKYRMAIELLDLRATLAAVTADLTKVREDWIRAEDMWRARQDHLLAAVAAENTDLKRDLEGARHANDAERGAWSRAWAILTGESEYGAHSDEAIVRAARAVSAERDALKVAKSISDERLSIADKALDAIANDSEDNLTRHCAEDALNAIAKVKP